MELEIKNRGFTLIELLVAMAAFSLIIVSMAGIATSVIKSQRKAFALQKVQESTRYILESISKEIRMSQINSLSSDDINTLSIVNSKNENVEYLFNSNRMTRKVDANDWEYISPSNIDLTGSFYIRKNSSPNRSFVTIVIKAESQGSRAEENAEIYLQNSVSSRPF